MKRQRMFVKWLAIVTCAAVLCVSESVGVTADNGAQIGSGADVLHLPLASVYSPFIRMSDKIYTEDLLVSFADDSLIRKVVHESDTEYQMIVPGETEMTVQTADGTLSDTVTLIVDPAIPMASDHVTVYTNSRYASRCFAYTPAHDGIYGVSFSLPDPSLHFTEVYDAAFEPVGTPSGGETVELIGGETYYFHPIADGDVVGNTYEFRVDYIGETVQEPAPSSVRFAQDEITMMLYDCMPFPSYTFEPGGAQWYDAVTFTADDDSILLIDYEEGMIEALSAGTVTLTVTADTYGWSDTVRITVVDAVREMYVDEPLPLTVYGDAYLAVMFTAPKTGKYVFYSVTEGEGDPVCGISDAETEESLAFGDDENGWDFVISVELKRWQSVWVVVAGYTKNLQTELNVGMATAATGVELYLPEAISHHGDVYYVPSGVIGEPLVRFLGEPTAEQEAYEILPAFYDGAQRDGNGSYIVRTGQALSFTVTTESGLTDAVMIVAIDLLPGDLDLDGVVGASDAAMAFYTINGAIGTDATVRGAMEVTGDNRITLADAARVFYAANGLLETA